jgi:hypothetical protein
VQYNNTLSDQRGATTQKNLAGPIPLNYQVRHEFFSFFLPHFPGALISERPLLPRRAGALWEGPVVFGRNRESRNREAAGRRNWPEQCPGKCAVEKGQVAEISENREEEHSCRNGQGETMRRRALWSSARAVR